MIPFLRLMSVGEIATWVFLDRKGRDLSKRGVVCATSVFRTESVDSKQRKDFYVVSYNDEPCLEMVIFLYVYLHCLWLATTQTNKRETKLRGVCRSRLD